MVKLLLSLTKPKALLILLVLAVGVAGANWYLYSTTQRELSAIKDDPRKAVQQETSELIAKVGFLVALPEGEEATVATVTDKERLKDQPFFSKAQNGDKVLIYTKAKKAYLYSVSMNKVLEVAPVNIGNTAQGEVAGEKATPTPLSKK